MPDAIAGRNFGLRSSPSSRVRQACVNCRRKKSKCPGEKPQCSICQRLDQVCTYEGFEVRGQKRRRSDAESSISRRASDEVSRRFSFIEQKLDQLTASVEKSTAVPVNSTSSQEAPGNSYQAQGRNFQSVPARRYNQPSSPHHLPEVTRSGSKLTPSGTAGNSIYAKFDKLPLDVIEDGIETYFKCFHAQPYSLMCQQASAIVAQGIDPIVLTPMLALSLRCSSHPFWTDKSRLRSWIHSLTEISWQSLLHMYGEGDNGLGYLQGLCLLAQVDFADGRVQRAHTQISLGVRIAQSLGYLADSATDNGGNRTEEIVRCTWTLFMLDRTFGITRLVSPTLSYQHFQLPKPVSESIRSRKAMHVDSSTDDHDLAALIVGVYSIWDDVIRYVFQTPSNSTTPPWQPGSELATIEYRFADFEPEFSTHRYREVGFPRRAIHEPHLRAYFAAWLCFQLTYMSIQCCIHHPFIMFIKLQHVIRKVPPSFLQKSYKSSLIHSRWIIRFLDEMDEAGMMLYDPFIGYLTAIAATIQLEHTLSKHADIAAAARLSFGAAIRFLKKLSVYWNSIQELLRIVEELAARLHHRHTLYYSQDDYDGILPEVETERVGLAADDITLMWKVFDYASMSASKTPTQTFGTVDGLDKKKEKPRAQSVKRPAAQDNSNISRRSDVAVADTSSSLTSTSLNDLPSLQGPFNTNLEPPDLTMFDQLPEDWAFTIDDWTLFGAPGSTYFYNDGS